MTFCNIKQLAKLLLISYNIFMKDMEKELNCLKIEYENKPVLLARGYNNSRTAIIVIDMLEGFCQKGNLYSPRHKALVTPIASALDYLPQATKFFLADNHTDDSLEFNFYPPHCHTKKESKVVDELAAFKGTVIEKDSTNGIFRFLEKVDTAQFDNYFVMGICTDICVLQFALSLKAYFNEAKNTANVMVFTDYTDTYDAPMHNAQLSNIMAYKNMEQSGVQIFKRLG